MMENWPEKLASHIPLAYPAPCPIFFFQKLAGQFFYHAKTGQNRIYFGQIRDSTRNFLTFGRGWVETPPQNGELGAQFLTRPSANSDIQFIV